MSVLIRIATFLAQAWYLVLRALLRPKRKIVFLSRQHNEPSLDFRLLAEALQTAEPGIEIVMRCRHVGPGAIGALRYAGEVAAQIRHLADASACVVDGYVVPVSVLDHRSDLFVLQMWHSLGAIKRFGRQAVGLPGGRPAHLAKVLRMHRNYDAVLCGGPASVPAFAEAFGVEAAAVRPLGLPRVDWMRRLRAACEMLPDSASAELRALARRSPELLDPAKRRVLYAPTYRKRDHAGFELLSAAFEGSECTLIVKPHFLDGAPRPRAGLVDATGCEVAELLPLCDAVVTDYSAVTFEAWCLDLPVYFFVFDHDLYAAEHGLNIDPLIELAGVSSKDAGEVAAWVRSAEYNPEAARRFARTYVPATDADCTQAIVELLLEQMRTRGAHDRS